MSEAAIKAEADAAMTAYERVTKVPATRTRAMIARNGYVGTLSKLMLSPDVQKGFEALVAAGQADLTFEAIVVRHPQFFSKDAAACAKWRLEQVKAIRKLPHAKP